MRKRFFTTLLISIVCICSAHAACEDTNCRCKGYAKTEFSCNPCQKGYYKNTEDDSECTKCDNGPTDTNAKYTEEGWTTPNCPWTLTCRDNTPCYDEEQKKCQSSEENTYVSGDGTVNFDGTKLTNNANCKKCPAGSKIQIDPATSKTPQITDCYMKIDYTQFCDKNGTNCIDFNNVFPSGSEIRYTE